MIIEKMMRMNMRTWIILFVLAVFTAFISSCVDETLVGNNNLPVQGGEKVRVEVPFKISYYKDQYSRSSSGIGGSNGEKGFEVCTDAYERTQTQSEDPVMLYNLWLLQFDKTGNRVGTAQHISTIDEHVEEYASLDVELTVGNEQTLFLAILGRQYERDLSSITRIEQLDNLYFNTFEADDSGVKPIVTNDDEIPMAGKVAGVNISLSGDTNRGKVEHNAATGFFGGIDVRRTLAKVSFRYKFDVADYEVKALQVHNVPASFTLLPVSGKPVAALHSMTIPSLPEPDSLGYCNLEWYLPQNCQGEVPSILNESERFYNYSLKTGNAPKDGIWVQLWSHQLSDPTFFSSYQIFMGKNNLTDFNVEANGLYFFTTFINLPFTLGGDNDNRINGLYASNSVEGYASEMVNLLTGVSSQAGTFGDKYDFDCHYDSRFLYVNGEGRRVEIFLVDENNNPITDESKAWLKISSFDNYTDAVRSNDLGLEAGVDLIVPTRVKFTLYCDEFVDPDITEKRVQRVRAKSISSDASARVLSDVVFIYRQVPIVDIGDFGGGFNAQKGCFNSRLGSDRIFEHWRYYEIPAPTTGYLGYAPPFGFDGSKVLEPAENDLWNGKNATRIMAENPRRARINVNGVEETKYIGGKPYLYQYNYYNSYVGRSCFDKNRDLNGNGVIDEDEMKWYLPASFQMTMWWISSGGTNNDAFDIRLYDSPNFSGGYYCANELNTSVTYGVTLNNKSDKGGNSGSGIGPIKSGRSLVAEVRCVRDLPVNGETPSTQVRTKNVDGTDKPVLVTSLDRASEMRSKQKDFFYISSPIYTYTFGGIGSVIADTTAKYENRIRRHTVSTVNGGGSYNPNQKVSRSFVVGKVDCMSDELTNEGDKSPELSSANTSRWAYLNGWSAEFNSYTNINSGTNAIRKGCSQYSEQQDGADKGKWRMPTQREMQLIAAFEPGLLFHSGQTGFQALTTNRSTPYATATEFQDVAVTIYLDPFQTVIQLDKKTLKKFKARCVRDLE